MELFSGHKIVNVLIWAHFKGFHVFIGKLLTKSVYLPRGHVTTWLDFVHNKSELRVTVMYMVSDVQNIAHILP